MKNMKNKEKVFSTDWLGRTLTFKTGLLAKHATAAVTVQYGDTVVLATVVQSKEDKDIPWFPLSVALEERLYAAGIIKGSQWIKREGRPSDDSILSGRMIDRSIRPLFDESTRKEIQIILTVLSIDKENDHDVVALIAASTVLSISGINWAGPLAGIRVAHIDDKLVYNPTFEERENSKLDLVVAGNKKTIIQIECGASEVQEDVMYKAITDAKKEMAPVIDLIEEMKKGVKIPNLESDTDNTISAEKIEKQQKIEQANNKANTWLDSNLDKILFDKEYYKKEERKAAVVAIKKQLKQHLTDEGVETDLISSVTEKTSSAAIDKAITREIIENKKRVDGRDITEVRDLTADVNILPRTHGVGLFSRGETQILSVATLAGPGLAQSIEGLIGNEEKRYMHHYNFAPFSVGECGFMRGPGRREIGHGALAEKALQPVLPTKDEFPYTIRIVSETLGSNGSSSMGATCGSTLALMHAGVPIKKPVAGIAIGLASYDDMSAWQVITDIQDLEDGNGGMDFKITGTRDGITAIQLDTKSLGLNDEIVKEALKQGKDARLKIIDVIEDEIKEPNKELSQYAPKIVNFKIDPEKIRDVIGAGGKVINGIIDETGVTIDIEDDGSVFVCGENKENSDKAVGIIKNITREFEVGEKFTGNVVRIMDFGIFVELAPGRDGMVHVSKLAPYRVNKPSDFVSVGDEVTVFVEEIDEQKRVNLTMKGLEENQALWKDEKGKDTGGGFGGNSNGRFNNKPNNKFNGKPRPYKK